MEYRVDQDQKGTKGSFRNGAVANDREFVLNSMRNVKLGNLSRRGVTWVFFDDRTITGEISGMPATKELDKLKAG